jgi:signal transduction histidine kinase
MNASATASAPRRRVRDWVVDTLLFLLAAVFGLLAGADQLEAATRPEPGWLIPLDQVAAALGCAGLWLRRRWPVGLALVLVALSTFSELVAGAMVVALFTVAVYRPPRTSLAVYGLSVLAALVYVLVRPEPGVPSLLLFLLGVAIQGAAVGWGLFLHYRRQLVESLRDRAARAETEAQLRAEQAQQRARDEIAREVPDLVGRTTYRIVQEALTNARKHAPGAEVEVQVAGAPGQGLTVEVCNTPTPVGGAPSRPGSAPTPVAGAASRRGSAPTPVAGAPDWEGSRPGERGRGVVHSPAPAVVAGGDPGPGQGLAGLAERVALADGRLEHGPTAAGGWRLAAWLPWPA